MIQRKSFAQQQVVSLVRTTQAEELYRVAAVKGLLNRLATAKPGRWQRTESNELIDKFFLYYYSKPLIAYRELDELFFLARLETNIIVLVSKVSLNVNVLGNKSLENPVTSDVN